MSPVSQDQHQQALRYLLAVVAPAAATIVAWVAQPLIGPSITLPFILAVGIAALYGGMGPGALASLLSVATLSYFFFPPIGSFAIASPNDLARQLMFVVVAAVTTWIAGTVHRQRWLEVRQVQENERPRRVAEEAATEAEMAAPQAAESLARQLEAEKALRRSEAELADFFDMASTALHWVGPDGTILRANQAELDLLGYERSEYVGHHIA